jgi:hypothetical protein
MLTKPEIVAPKIHLSAIGSSARVHIFQSLANSEYEVQSSEVSVHLRKICIKRPFLDKAGEEIQGII